MMYRFLDLLSATARLALVAALALLSWLLH